MIQKAISRAAILMMTSGLVAQPMLAHAQGAINTPPSSGTMTSPATPAPLAAPPAQTGVNRSAQTTSSVPPSSAAKAAGVPAARTTQGQRDVNVAETRINQLHRQLKITSAEQPQWDAFAQVMRENAQHMDQVFAQHGNPQNGTALDDMKAYEMITQAHAEDVSKLEPAFEALYNAMSPEQKRTADDVFHQYARQQAQRAGRG